MLKFAFRHMAVRAAKLIMISLSIIITACVALLSYNISTQVSEGIVQTASNYDIIIGPSGSSTQLAMNTMFFTDKPLGTIPYSIVEEIETSGLAQKVVPFSMGDSYNASPIVGTEPALLDGKSLTEGAMFEKARDAVVGYEVARQYGLKVGDKIITSHGLGGSSGGHAHEEAPLTVTGVLARTNTSYDNAVFTSVETIWALHGHSHEEDEEHDHEEEGEEHAHEEEAHDHEAHTICAVLVRSNSISDYSTLMSRYSEGAEYLAINPNTVLREVLENVDLSRTIVYILCGVILVMNIFVISMIALLNAYDSRKEIAMMRLIGVSMQRINLLYLCQNALSALAALVISLAAAHGGLAAIRSFVASMGIVLNAGRIYPMEWAILAVVFVISVLPTAILTMRMAGRDSIDR